MTLSFPNNPSLNQRFIFNDFVYTWNGSKWITGPTKNNFIASEYTDLFSETQETFITLDTKRYNFFDITTSNTSANLLKNTQNFSNSSTWTSYGVSIVDNAIYDPIYGKLSADSFIETNGHTTDKYIIQSFSFNSGTTYTMSIYAKAIGSRYISLLLPSAAFGSDYSSIFNLSDGTYWMNTSATSGGATATITPIINGWYRCTFTATATNTSNAIVQYRITNSPTTTASYTGDGVSGLYLWGAQMEVGSTASKYKQVDANPYYNVFLTNTSVYDKILVKSTIGGSNTIEWHTSPNNIIWSTGVAPTMIQNKINIIEFQKFKDQWYGYVLVNDVNI